MNDFVYINVLSCLDKLRLILKEMKINYLQCNEEVDKCLDEGTSNADAIVRIEKGVVNKYVKNDYRHMSILKFLASDTY